MAFDAARLEINLTYACNLRCTHCDRLTDLVRFHSSEVTYRQIQLFVAELRERDVRIHTLKVAGGEPLLHRRFERIIACLRRLQPRNVSRILVLTNGVREMPPLPRRCEYSISSPASKQHYPFAVSPRDLFVRGLIGSEKRCPIITKCGSLFDRWGFSFCPVAGIVGRAAGVNPYSDVPVFAGRAEICQHCVYSVSQPLRQSIYLGVKAGLIECPSRSYQQAVRQIRKSGESYPVWRPS